MNRGNEKWRAWQGIIKDGIRMQSYVFNPNKAIAFMVYRTSSMSTPEFCDDGLYDFLRVASSACLSIDITLSRHALKNLFIHEGGLLLTICKQRAAKQPGEGTKSIRQGKLLFKYDKSIHLIGWSFIFFLSFLYLVSKGKICHFSRPVTHTHIHTQLFLYPTIPLKQCLLHNFFLNIVAGRTCH